MTFPNAEAVLHAVGAGVVCVDAAGIVCSWSRGAERLFGVPAAEACGTSLVTLVAAPNSRDDAARALSETPPEATFEMACRRPDGQEVRVEVAVTPLDPGAGESNRVLLLRALPPAAELPAVGILAPTAAARLHHDVANPLNALLGFAYLLRTGEAGELPARANEMVEDLTEAAREVKLLLERALVGTPHQ